MPWRQLRIRFPSVAIETARRAVAVLDVAPERGKPLAESDVEVGHWRDQPFTGLSPRLHVLNAQLIAKAGRFGADCRCRPLAIDPSGKVWNSE